MTKIWKSTLTCIAVLSFISLVSVILVLSLNKLLPAKTSFFNRKKLESVCLADDYYQLTDKDLEEKGISLDEFNSPYKTSAVRVVFRAKGGINDGKYIIESQGFGYSDRYPIILYIAYDTNGSIMRVTDLQVDKGNTFWSDLKPYLNDIYSGLIGKSGEVGGGADLLNTSTGATQSMNGIARAVNIANTFIIRLNETSKMPAAVTDETLLNELRAITAPDAEFTGYPYENIGTIDDVTAQVINVYVSDKNDIIFETKSDAGSYGRVTLLVSVDTTDMTVRKIYPRSVSAVDSSKLGIISEVLADKDVLTSIFGGLGLDGIDLLDKHLTGSTGATQTSNGLKVAVKAALESINGFMEEWEGDFGGDAWSIN